MWLLLAVVCLGIGLLIGWSQGQNGKGARERLRHEQAKAWQQGFEAARQPAPGIPARPAPIAPTPVQQQPWQPGQLAPPQHAAAPHGGATGHSAGSHGTGPTFDVPLQPAARFGTAAPPLPPRPVPSPEQRTLRNINITLYVAALMVVAASSLVIGLVFPALVKVLGLGLLTIAFYAGGLLMHAKSARLRPAAAAFTGTGLALIPITGLAHYLLLSQNPGVSWFASSVVGTVAFIYATARLQSRVLAAMSTTFLVSTAWSGGSILNRGMIWYFLFSMLAATAITLLRAHRPGWVANIYAESFTAAHRFLVPATLAAALFSTAVLDAGDYALVFAGAGAYYVVAACYSAPSERLVQSLAARAALTVALGALLVHAGLGAADMARVLVAFVVAQLLLVLALRRRYVLLAGMNTARLRSESWIVLGVAGVLVLIGSERLAGRGSLADWTPGAMNWSLPVLLVGAAVAARLLGGSLLWAPLATALLVLGEPGYGSPGRVGLVFIAASLLTCWVASGCETFPRRQLILAVRALSPITAGTVLAWLAAGATFAPHGGVVQPTGTGVLYGNGYYLGELVMRASAVGFILALIVQALLTARNLGSYRRTGSPEAVPGRLWLIESLMLPAGALFGGIAVWFLALKEGTRLFAGLRASTPDSGNPAYRLVFEVPWAAITAVALLAGILWAATHVLGNRWRNESPALSAAVLPRAVRPVVHGAGLAAIVLVTSAMLLLDPQWLFVAAAALSMAYAGIRVVSPGQGLVRGGYAILAQMLFTAAALRVADLWNADLHARTALAAFTLAAGQGLRVRFARTGTVFAGTGLARSMGWGALALLLLIPLGYAVATEGGSDQASLLLQNAFLIAYALTCWLYGEPKRGNGHKQLALAGAGAGILGIVLTPALEGNLRHGGWLPTPLWDGSIAALLCALLVIALITAEALGTGGTGYRQLRAVFSVLYLGALLGIRADDSARWLLLAAVLAAIGFLVYSATIGRALLLAGTVACTVLAAIAGIGWWHEVNDTAPNYPADLMLGWTAAALVLCVAAVSGGRFSGPAASLSGLSLPRAGWDSAHARVLYLGVLLVLVGTGLAGASDTGALAYIGCLLLVAVAFSAAFTEVPARMRETGLIGAALVAAAAAQRSWSVYREGIDPFWAIQYWVVVLGLLAGYEFFRKRGQRGIRVLFAAAVLLSIGALAGWTAGQQFWVLLAFCALLAAGLLLNRRTFVIWGSVGAGLMVLWFLRNFTFLLLFVVAAGLIAVALWRLARMGGRNARPAPTAQPQPGTSPGDRHPGPGHGHGASSPQAPEFAPPPPPPSSSP